MGADCQQTSPFWKVALTVSLGPSGFALPLTTSAYHAQKDCVLLQPACSPADDEEGGLAPCQHHNLHLSVTTELVLGPPW